MTERGNELPAHWERVYQTSADTAASWYQPKPRTSLELIEKTGVPPDAALIDVGAGSSTLVDHLMASGYRDVTLLDISPTALAHARARLGAAATRLHWVTADIIDFQPLRRYTLWHDRAVFHFLIDPYHRDRYLAALGRSLAPDGHLLLSTFGPAGPTRCSGLPVQGYSEAELSAVLGPAFRLRESRLEDHETPSGKQQQFLYGWWTLKDYG